ncbi:mechanosensitive ion channel family protein [Alloacidobacterium dinghuense]|uniref:Mechanosensitive ion channel family protein n=1 Tax=Alloacidobacterium dinghuense TaxID=2763107 RepID=A0A7G8BN97_9BACT|nr:mechanosensitive ion channel domain-containing protein [Alloacidobacterium dinghuense]QNI34017.1 mechanosensitive ion channel family protein [Alloacidobacterium dinghuense]
MRFRPPLHICACAITVLLAAFSLSGQTQDQKPATATLDERQILHHLNSVITWYRKNKTQIQPVGLPTDALYQSTANKMATEVVALAFASAEKAAPLLPSEIPQGAASTSHQNLVKLLQDTTTHNAQLQTQINQLNSKIASARRRDVQALTDQRDRLQGELDLGKSMINSLTQLTRNSEQKATKKKGDSENQPNPNGFEASVAQLKSTLPEIFDPKNQPVTASTPQNINSPTGLFGALHRLYDQSVSLRQIESLQLETNQLEDFVNTLRSPLRTELRATIQQGRALSTTADNPQPGEALPSKQDFDTLAARFDQIAGVEVPLSQEVVALDESKANLEDWRNSIRRESGALLRSVLVRVGIMIAVLGFLLLISDLWKRATFRYIADNRRRRQFLVVRRFVIGFLIGLVLIFSFVTEFSALATFAGFLTAGIAVGLQTILLSVAAYFFLIGRYGIRVGDRITISGVTGDVIDVGFVRFYMLELAGTGIDLQPTGRVVAFANAVLFQPTTPMFKQVPGTHYSWHEISIGLQPAGNHKLVEETMMQIVQSVYEKYQPLLDRQQRSIEERFEVPFAPLKPKAQLQLTDTGLEAVVRYPVSLRHNVEADDEITRRLLQLISRNGELKETVAGLPKIRSAVRA